MRFELTLEQLIMLDVLDYMNSKIPIHVYQPNSCFYSSLDFTQCPQGVAYGMENYTESN